MSEVTGIRQARSMEADYQKMLEWLQKLENLLDMYLDDEVPDLLESFQENVGNHYQRVIFGYEVLVENCCDKTLSYLDFKPEIKAAMDRYNGQCTWTLDDDYAVYETGCGESVVFDDGTPQEHGYKFCHYCGKAIKFVEANYE